MTDQQKRIYWNRNWQFLKGFEESYLGRQAIGKVQKAEQVELPHTVQEVPLHYFDESLYQGIFTYRKVFRPDADMFLPAIAKWIWKIIWDLIPYIL